MSDSSERTLRPRNSLFRRTERGVPEATGTTEPTRAPKRDRIKATFYLEPDDILAIDQLQSEAFKRSGKKPERSVLVSRAIQQFFKTHQEG